MLSSSSDYRFIRPVRLPIVTLGANRFGDSEAPTSSHSREGQGEASIMRDPSDLASSLQEVYSRCLGFLLSKGNFVALARSPAAPEKGQMSKQNNQTSFEGTGSLDPLSRELFYV